MKPIALHLATLLLLPLIAANPGCSSLWPSGDDKTVAESEVKSSATPNSEANAKEEPGQTLLRKRMIVLPFLNKSRHGGNELSSHARDMIFNTLFQTPEFALVPNAEIEGSENFVNDLGEYEFRKIYDAARSHGISGIIGGAIEDVLVRETGDEIGLFRTKQFAVVATVRVKLFDANTERELMSRLTSADVTEERTEFFNARQITQYDPERGKVAVQKALEKVVGLFPAYAKKIAWSGRIAKINMHRFYITAGEMSGIPKGQLLKVFEEGQPVWDPDTKQLVGVAPGRFKGLLKVIDHFGGDGSVAVIHSGAGFREKDRVEIFSQMQNR